MISAPIAKQWAPTGMCRTPSYSSKILYDLNDPNSMVSKLLKENQYEVLLPEKDLGPNVYYVGIEKFRNFIK